MLVSWVFKYCTVLLLRWGGSAVRLNFHLNGTVLNLVSYYLTSPIVLVVFFYQYF